MIEYGIESQTLDFKMEQYTKEHTLSFIKDIMSMANAHNTEDKYIIIGINYIHGIKNDIVGITEKFKDQAIYQNTIYDNIEPQIHFEYFPYQWNDKLLGIFRIHSCNDRPYMMKKDFSTQDPKKALRRGDCYIRRGDSQNNVIRRDLDEMIKDKLKKNKINDEDIQIIFSESKSDEISLSKIGTLDISNKFLDKKAVENAIEDRKGGVPPEKIHPVFETAYNMGISKKTPKMMTLEELEDELEYRIGYNKEIILHETFENYSSKLNFLIQNNSEMPLENALFTLKVSSKYVNIADMIYKGPGNYPTISPYVINPNYHDPYPDVEKIDEKYSIMINMGKIRQHSPYPNLTFEEPIRIFVRNKCEKSEIEIECQINADNLPKPIIKTLKIKVKGD